MEPGAAKVSAAAILVGGLMATERQWAVGQATELLSRHFFGSIDEESDLASKLFATRMLPAKMGVDKWEPLLHAQSHYELVAHMCKEHEDELV